MPLCTYSTETHSGAFLVIENTFINDYLPVAPAQCVKVYLYGLYLCANPSSVENSIENMCKVLNMEASDIKESFEYWQAEGLLQILESPDGKEINAKFLPVSKRAGSSKKRTNKYTEFNSKLQSLFKNKMITPTEYNEYYTLIESYHIDENGLILIADYCIKLKGERISYQYITTVAKSFASEGITSLEQIKDKLNEHQEIMPELLDILKAMGKKTTLSIEDRNLYVKWKEGYGYDHGTIKEVAKTLKGKPNASMFKLDNSLSSYFKLKLFSIKEITEYTTSQEKYFEIAKNITHTLGLYYDNLSTIIENYIMDWVKQGFDEDSLNKISKYCLKNSTRTMEGMNTVIQKFYTLGVISSKSVDQYLKELNDKDKLIKQILDCCNIVRAVNTYDRSSYNTWINTWNLTHDIVMYVAELSKDKALPTQYMNKILSTLYDNNITTLEEAKKYLEKQNNSTVNSPTKNKKSKRPSTEREISKEEFTSLLDNLDNIEI